MWLLSVTAREFCPRVARHTWIPVSSWIPVSGSRGGAGSLAWSRAAPSASGIAPFCPFWSNWAAGGVRLLGHLDENGTPVQAVMQTVVQMAPVPNGTHCSSPPPCSTQDTPLFCSILKMLSRGHFVHKACDLSLSCAQVPISY